MSEIEILQKVKPKKLIELMCNLPGSKWPICSLMFTFLTLLAHVVLVSIALVIHLLVADCLLVQHHSCCDEEKTCNKLQSVYF